MRFFHHIFTGRSVPCDTIADGTEKNVVSLGRFRLVVTAEILAIYQTRHVSFEYAGGPGRIFFSDFPSPPQRLPLGIPIKIEIKSRKNRKRAGDDGKSLIHLPVVPRALSFSFSPASPQHKEASAEEREWLLLLRGVNEDKRWRIFRYMPYFVNKYV